MEPIYVVLIIVGVVVLGAIILYNSLISKRNQVDNAFASIDVMLKKRADLIPSLVSTVKGYAAHEKELFESITKARTEVKTVDLNSDRRVELENQITAGIGRMMWVSESYPDLKANTNFLKLQDELSNLEDAIQNARRYYNAIVRDYNFRLEAFPDLFIAQRFHYTPRDYFELDVSEAADVKKMPKINL